MGTGLRTCTCVDDGSIDDVYIYMYICTCTIDRSIDALGPAVQPYGHRAIAYNIMINRLSAEYSPGRS